MINEISKNPVAVWVREREPEFYRVLRETGQSIGMGFERISRFDRGIRKDRDMSGEFTGESMCRLANAALGGEINRRFWRKGFRVESVLVQTLDRDTNLGWYTHNILRVRHLAGNVSKITVDPTLRQFSMSVQEGRAAIFPTDNEVRVYPQMLVVEVGPIHKLWLDVMLDIGTGGFGEMKIRDYRKITDALRD